MTKRKHWSQVYTHHLPNNKKSQLWFRPQDDIPFDAHNDKQREKRKKKKCKPNTQTTKKKSARIVILSSIKYSLFAPWFINVYCNIFSFSLWLFHNIGRFFFQIKNSIFLSFIRLLKSLLLVVLTIQLNSESKSASKSKSKSTVSKRHKTIHCIYKKFDSFMRKEHTESIRDKQMSGLEI